jgi:hypothetical protein
MDEYAEKHELKALFTEFMVELMKKKPDNPVGCIRQHFQKIPKNEQHHAGYSGRQRVLSKKEKTAMTEETQAYLTKMQVGLLFKNFTASLLKERPEAPLVWLQQYLAENDLDNLVQSATDQALSDACRSDGMHPQVASLTTMVPRGTQVETLTNNGTLTIGGDSDMHITIQRLHNSNTLSFLKGNNVIIRHLENHGTVVGSTKTALEATDPTDTLGMNVGDFVEQDTNTIKVGSLQNANVAVISSGSSNNGPYFVIIETLVNGQSGTITIDRNTGTYIGHLENDGTLVEL